MINQSIPQNRLFKQTNVGKWWGAFRNLGSYISFYLFIINTIVLLINTYILGNTFVYGLPIPMWTIILITIAVFFVLLLSAMLFEHKYTIPSFMTYWNSNWWNHGNPLPGKIEAMQKHNDDRFDAIERMIKEKP